MNGGYLLALASQPAGQVLLQQADRALSAVQRSLEVADVTGIVKSPDPSATGAGAESPPLRRLGFTVPILQRASHAGSSLRSRLLKSVDPQTATKVVSFFNERREAIEALKLKGLELMMENSEVMFGQNRYLSAVLWPLARVISYMNRIARPYVTSPQRDLKEMAVVVEDVVAEAAEGAEDARSDGDERPDDSSSSWRTSSEELPEEEQRLHAESPSKDRGQDDADERPDDQGAQLITAALSGLFAKYHVH